MYNPYYSHGYHHPHGAYYQPGLIGVLGGILGLTTATLQASTRIIRTVVEGTVWYGCHDCDFDCYHPDPCFCHHEPHAEHCYHIECVPPCYGHCC